MALKPVSNPPNPWRSTHVDWLGEPPPATTQVYLEHARSALSRNDSPDLPFRWGINPYHGCAHACAYCYARPWHEYWDFGAGSDFERKIVVRHGIADRLRETFNKPSWKGETVAFSGITDCYQPLEAHYRLTRACLEVCADFRNPVGIITKGALVRRDLDLLTRLATEARVHVNISLAFADPELCRVIDSGAPSPRVRIETIRQLTDAGISVGLAVAPIIPGLNDDQIVEVLERAREAGATRCFRALVRLNGPVATVFEERVRAGLPLRADKILNGIREMRSGSVEETGFGARMVGSGPRWDMVARLFDTTCRRLGYLSGTEVDGYWSEELRASTTFVRPGSQMTLF